MRTAEAMIKELDSALLFTDVKNLMIQYAKEAIIECSKRAKCIDVSPQLSQSNMGMQASLQNQQSIVVDKQSILNLINELQ